MALVAGGLAVENKGELSMCMPSGFPEDVQPHQQSVADVERSKRKAARKEAMNIFSDRHKATGT